VVQRSKIWVWWNQPRQLRWLARFVISCALLAVLFSWIDLQAFWQAIQRLNWSFFLFSVLLFYPAQLFAAYRWYFLLLQLGLSPAYNLIVRYTLLGQIAALVLPGQVGGDVVRALALAQHERQVAVPVLSVLIDKLTLLFALFLFALAGLWSTTLARFALLFEVTAVLCVLILFVLVLLCLYRPPIATVRRWTNQFPVTRKLTPTIQEWVQVPPIPISTLIALFLLSVLWQIINIIGSYLLARAMNIAIAPVDWMALNAMVALVQILPVSLGGLGVREGAWAALLALYNVPPAQSTAFSLISFTAMILLLAFGWAATEWVYPKMLHVARSP